MASTNITRPKTEEDSYEFFFIVDVATYIVGFTVVVTNLTIALAFIIQKCRRTNLWRLTPAGLLVLNLLMSDAFIGAVNTYMTETMERNKARYRYRCLGRVAVAYLGLIGSHVALLNVVVDRYVAIMHTLHYRDWMTFRRSVIMVTVGWCVPIAGAAGAMLSNNWQPGLSLCSEISGFRIFMAFVWIPSHLLALVIIIVVQCRMYFHLKHHESTPANSTVLRRYSHRSAQVLYRVTSTFVICWGPFDVMLLTIVFFPGHIVKVIYDVTNVMAHLSFLVNPCIFSYRTESIRKPVNALYEEIKEAVICRAKKVVEPSKDGGNEQNEGQTTHRGAMRKASSSVSVLTQSSSLSASLELSGHTEVVRHIDGLQMQEFIDGSVSTKL